MGLGATQLSKLNASVTASSSSSMRATERSSPGRPSPMPESLADAASALSRPHTGSDGSRITAAPISPGRPRRWPRHWALTCSSSGPNPVEQRYVRGLRQNLEKGLRLNHNPPRRDTILALLFKWIDDYCEVHPRSGLKLLTTQFLRLSA